MRCEIDLVDYQKIGSRDVRSSLGRNFVACGYVNDRSRRLMVRGSRGSTKLCLRVR